MFEGQIRAAKRRRKTHRLSHTGNGERRCRQRAKHGSGKSNRKLLNARRSAPWRGSEDRDIRRANRGDVSGGYVHRKLRGALCNGRQIGLAAPIYFGTRDEVCACQSQRKRRVSRED